MSGLGGRVENQPARARTAIDTSKHEALPYILLAGAVMPNELPDCILSKEDADVVMVPPSRRAGSGDPETERACEPRSSASTNLRFKSPPVCQSVSRCACENRACTHVLLLSIYTFFSVGMISRPQVECVQWGRPTEKDGKVKVDV